MFVYLCVFVCVCVCVLHMRVVYTCVVLVPACMHVCVCYIIIVYIHLETYTSLGKVIGVNFHVRKFRVYCLE